MNITQANTNVENINAAIAELEARIAHETNEHREAVAKRDNLASLLANGEITPDQVASVQAEPEGYATILAQYRNQRDQLTRALAAAELDVIVAEAESEESPLLTHEDKLNMVAEIVEAMTPALNAYAEKVKAHNAEYDRVFALAPRVDGGNSPVSVNPCDSMKKINIGERAFTHHGLYADSLLTDAVAKKMAELR